MSEVSAKLIVDKRMENKMISEDLYRQISQWHAEVWGGTREDEQAQAHIVSVMRQELGEEIYEATLNFFNEQLRKS